MFHLYKPESHQKYYTHFVFSFIHSLHSGKVLSTGYLSRGLKRFLSIFCPKEAPINIQTVRDREDRWNICVGQREISGLEPHTCSLQVCSTQPCYHTVALRALYKCAQKPYKFLSVRKIPVSLFQSFVWASARNPQRGIPEHPFCKPDSGISVDGLHFT